MPYLNMKSRGSYMCGEFKILIGVMDLLNREFT